MCKTTDIRNRPKCWINGETYLWVGRRKRTGRGEGSSGLRFDVVLPES